MHERLVQAERAKIEQHERKFGLGEHGGYTHALWSEIKSVPLDEAL